MKITVWTLAADDTGGTWAQAFASEREAEDALLNTLGEDRASFEAWQAEGKDRDCALWDFVDEHKADPSLDTYQIESTELELQLATLPGMAALIHYAETSPAIECEEGYWDDMEEANTDGQRSEQSRAAAIMRAALKGLGIEPPAGYAVCEECYHRRDEGHNGQCSHDGDDIRAEMEAEFEKAKAAGRELLNWFMTEHGRDELAEALGYEDGDKPTEALGLPIKIVSDGCALGDWALHTAGARGELVA